MIEVNNLKKKYGEYEALKGISFSIDKGKIYGFLGPNGAGKSTTMNIITGYLAPTSGQISINGNDMLKEPEQAKKSIGYLPEMPPVYLDMTVCEYLAFAAELKCIDKRFRKKQCDVVTERLKLQPVAGRLIGNLSKGYRQRVGLAQAILGFPNTIILDEPMVGLDPEQIIEMRDLIRSLAKNHTVLLSSHILGEVRETCDELLIIAGGRLVAQDSPDNLESKYCCDETIHLEAKGELENIKETLLGVEGAGETTYKRLDNEWYQANVIPKQGCEIREEIFSAFVRQGVPLRTLYQEQPSLEDVYIKLVQEGGQSHDSSL